jgi:hypothetical protein
MRFAKTAACLGIAATATAAATVSAAGPSVVAGGCRVRADATLSPGLTLSSHAFEYAYRGKLNLCVYTGKGAARGGTITAGEQIEIGGHLYQEPVPTGTGTCLGTTSRGYDFARWSNGTQTIVQFSTASASGVTRLSGSVIQSLRLRAVHPSAGEPSSAAFPTTNFLGQDVVGRLDLRPSDPSLCGKPQGLTHATITGVLGHVGLIGG